MLRRRRSDLSRAGLILTSIVVSRGSRDWGGFSMGAYLVPVSKVHIAEATFDSDGKTIIHFLYSFENRAMLESIRKLETLVVEQDTEEGQFFYRSIVDGL